MNWSAAGDALNRPPTTPSTRYSILLQMDWAWPPPNPSDHILRTHLQNFTKICDSGCSELSSYLFLINPWIVDVPIRTYDTSHLTSGGQSGDRHSTLYDGIYMIEGYCTDSNTDSMDPWCCWYGLTVFLETHHLFSNLPKELAHLRRWEFSITILIASLF